MRLPQDLLARLVGEELDNHFVRAGLLRGFRFFNAGWGDLSSISHFLPESLKVMHEWPPVGIRPTWKEVERGVKDGFGYKLYEGAFKTPCMGHMHRAMPPESRTGRVQFLVPDQTSGRKTSSFVHPGAALGCAVHLAATGDQGFNRRLRLGQPLLPKRVCSLVHESPFYGQRRPPSQRSAKLMRVSDLFVLGYSTIYESVNLMHYLEEGGFGEGGLSMVGLSMGGVHACMSAAVYPKPVGVASLLAPRSAAAAYCDGALAAAMSWASLQEGFDEKGVDVSEVVRAASRAVSCLGSANYVVHESDQAKRWGLGEVAESTTGGQQSSRDGSFSSSRSSMESLSSSGAGSSTWRRAQLQDGNRQSKRENRLSILTCLPVKGQQQALSLSARLQLNNVLETFTDVSRFPMPRCPEAAVLVAAENDGYVPVESVKQLHRHWKGSELRLVSGGHVSAFLLHQDRFRQAILDSIARLHDQKCRPN